MARVASLTKRSLITKANRTMVTATGVAAFLVVFSLVASNTLFSQMLYQNRVISAKRTAKNQLVSDLSARDSLVNSYKTFVSPQTNLIGGNSDGSGAKGGDNAQLVLDALPSQYDFPALATTLEKLLTSDNLQILSITGTDEELSQQSASNGSSAPIPMPFQFEVSGSYQSIQSMIASFESSIRPFQVQTIQLAGTEGSMTATVSAQTFYQPGVTLNITNKVVQ
ncbi:MAG TPA: hypothetical protein VIM53_03965 [Candidatus Saccharimonadales bacterium]